MPVNERDEAYGSRLIDRLAVDIGGRFSGARRWSPRNLRYMRAFALGWPADEIWQARLQNLSLTHHQVLLNSFSDTQSASLADRSVVWPVEVSVTLAANGV